MLSQWLKLSRPYTNTGHDRYEVRCYRLVNNLSTLPDPHTWAGLGRIGRVACERHEGGRVSCEHRYFITSLVGEVHAFANAVRAHWSVENCLH